MNAFTWLLIGHLLGDWLLQNDWMARGKREGLFTLAGMIHFSIYTVVTTGLLWLSGTADKAPVFYLGVGIIIFVSHWLVDSTNLVQCWMQFYHQSQIEMVRVMADQTLHLLVLWLVALFFL